MRSHLLILLIALLSAAVTAFAEEPSQKSVDSETIVKATYIVSGLHCPPCTDTVEASLEKVKGIRSIHVDWKSKKARIEFDEAVLPAQKVAQLIAGTPHMMGRKMRYGAFVLLKVPDVKDDASAKQIKETVSKVKGVHRVIAYPKEHSIGVMFVPKGEMTSQQLIDALGKAGVEAEMFWPEES
jgi:copper chaperone CopZ